MILVFTFLIVLQQLAVAVPTTSLNRPKPSDTTAGGLASGGLPPGVTYSSGSTGLVLASSATRGTSLGTISSATSLLTRTPLGSGLPSLSSNFSNYLSPIATAASRSTLYPQLTSLKDASMTAVYGFTQLTQFSAITSPTTAALTYVQTASDGQGKTTFGPVFIGAGGVVLFPTPKPGAPPHIDGTSDILGGVSEPIRPGPPGSKCPKILGFLCGSTHISGSDDGSDVDPDDKTSV